MPDAFSQLLAYEIWPGVPLVPIVAMAVFFILIMVIIKKSSKKDDTFKPMDIDVEGPKEFEEGIKEAGANIYSNGFMLMNGPIKIGRVSRFSPTSWDSQLSIMQNLKNASKRKEMLDLIKQVRGEGLNPQDMVNNFFMFEVIKDSLVGKILYFFGSGKNYHLVDRELIKQSWRQFEINLYARPWRWYKNVWIYTGKGKAVALNISDKITAKKVSNSIMNMAPKIDYMETKTAGWVAKAREGQNIKHTDWKKKEQNLNPDEEPQI